MKSVERTKQEFGHELDYIIACLVEVIEIKYTKVIFLLYQLVHLQLGRLENYDP